MSEFLDHELEYRGSEIIDRRFNFHIAICGAGALGSHLADILVRQGYCLLSVYDKDSVERKNIGNQIYEPTDIGRSKAIQLANKLTRRYGIKGHNGVVATITASTVKKLKNSQLVIDVFDNTASRKIIKDFCAISKIPCLHAGMSKDGFAEIVWNENYYPFEVKEEVNANAEEPCEYPLAVNLVFFTVVITAEIINKFVDKGVKTSVQFTLNDMHIDMGQNT